MLVCALAERGAFAEAHELLRERGLDGALGPAVWEIGVRHARARLWLAEGDFERAYAEACEAGELRERAGPAEPDAGRRGARPPRSRSRTSAAASEAAALADVELARAERFGAPVPIVVALHARAVAEPDDAARVALCERALAAVAGRAGALESVRVRLELGSTLPVLGRRVEARDALRPGAGRRRRRGRGAAGRSARAASSSRPGCARGRRRSRAPRR